MKANTARGLRLAFGQEPSNYAQARRAIPQVVVDAIQALCGVEGSSDVLEIGPGTGQLTGGLLRAGLRKVTAVEPDGRFIGPLARLAAVQGGLETIINDYFEDADLGSASFDLIAACDAFHWVDPAISYAKCSQLLRSKGILVLMWTFPALQADLQARMSDALANVVPEAMSPLIGDWRAIDRALEEGRQEAEASRLFKWRSRLSYIDALEFTPTQYAAFLTTYAGLAAAHAARAGLLRRDLAEAVATVTESVVVERRVEVMMYDMQVGE